MDNTETITHISLCSGYGGIDLGLRRCIPGLRTVAYSEIEAAACELLLARMEGGQLDPAPIWTDLKSFPWGAFRGRVDILSGGYPCQPFSTAGKRAGKDDPRHLWPWIADGIRILQPRVCFFENVEGHITLGLSTVVSDLEELGYSVSWGLFSAAECGAPHQRKRVFVLAYDKCAGLEGLNKWNTPSEQTQPFRADTGAGGECPAWPSRPGEPQYAWEPPRVVGNADCGRQSFGLHAGGGAEADPRGQGDAVAAKPRQTQSSLGGNIARTTSGLGYGELCISYDNRTDELRMLGNGVVPATAELAFRVLISELI